MLVLFAASVASAARASAAPHCSDALNKAGARPAPSAAQEAGRTQRFLGAHWNHAERGGKAEGSGAGPERPRGRPPFSRRVENPKAEAEGPRRHGYRAAEVDGLRPPFGSRVRDVAQRE